MKEKYLFKTLEDMIDESYNEKLKELLTKEKLNDEEIIELNNISKKIQTNYGFAENASTICSLEDPAFSEESEEKSLAFLKAYSEVKKRIGATYEKTEPKSCSHDSKLKYLVANNYLESLQSEFEYLQKKKIKSDIPELQNRYEIKTEIGSEIEIFTVSETDSPYYNVKNLLKKVESIYDELAFYYLSHNYTHEAYSYYYFLGEVLIKEIYIANLLSDDLLYDKEDKAFLYRNAGESFLRAYKAIYDKHIVIFYAPPMSPSLRSNIGDVFGTGNIIQSPEKLSIFCFELAKELFRIVGNKKYYLEARDKLYELKAETNDFEFNISKLFVEISKIFVKNKAPFLKMLDKPTNIKEEYVRDYFLSHVNLMIEDISVAENLRTRGRSDLTIFGKDNFGKVLEVIVEFKVWGRNSTHKDHSYKNVLNQLRIYMSDFEEFGIIVMINPNKSSIKDKYIKNIIENDEYLIENSIEELYSEGAFVNLKSEHYVENDRSKKMRMHHFILNIQNLFFTNDSDNELEINSEETSINSEN